MSERRTPPMMRVLNAVANPALIALLRSRAHGMASGRLLVLRYRGRRTGAEHELVTLYSRRGESVRIMVAWPDDKVWWRNLTGDGAPVELWLRGDHLTGHAVARHEPGQELAEVLITLDEEPE